MMPHEDEGVETKEQRQQHHRRLQQRRRRSNEQILSSKQAEKTTGRSNLVIRGDRKDRSDSSDIVTEPSSETSSTADCDGYASPVDETPCPAVRRNSDSGSRTSKKLTATPRRKGRRSSASLRDYNDSSSPVERNEESLQSLLLSELVEPEDAHRHRRSSSQPRRPTGSRNRESLKKHNQQHQSEKSSSSAKMNGSCISTDSKLDNPRGSRNQNDEAKVWRSAFHNETKELSSKPPHKDNRRASMHAGADSRPPSKPSTGRRRSVGEYNDDSQDVNDHERGHRRPSSRSSNSSNRRRYSTGDGSSSCFTTDSTSSSYQSPRRSSTKSGGSSANDSPTGSSNQNGGRAQLRSRRRRSRSPKARSRSPKNRTSSTSHNVMDKPGTSKAKARANSSPDIIMGDSSSLKEDGMPRDNNGTRRSGTGRMVPRRNDNGRGRHEDDRGRSKSRERRQSRSKSRDRRQSRSQSRTRNGQRRARRRRSNESLGEGNASHGTDGDSMQRGRRRMGSVPARKRMSRGGRQSRATSVPPRERLRNGNNSTSGPQSKPELSSGDEPPRSHRTKRRASYGEDQLFGNGSRKSDIEFKSQRNVNNIDDIVAKAKEWERSTDLGETKTEEKKRKEKKESKAFNDSVSEKVMAMTIPKETEVDIGKSKRRLGGGLTQDLTGVTNRALGKVADLLSGTNNDKGDTHEAYDNRKLACRRLVTPSLVDRVATVVDHGKHNNMKKVKSAAELEKKAPTRLPSRIVPQATGKPKSTWEM